MTIRFERVMSGEYVSTPDEDTRYHVWRSGSDCPDCDHHHDYWKALVYLGFKGTRDLGKFPTMTEARTAVQKHYAAISSTPQ